MLTVDLDRARIGPDRRVLDLGCGGGRHAFACLRAGAQVVAVDASDEALASVVQMIDAMGAAHEVDPRDVAVALGDALALPVADHVFDCVIASEVLEHLFDDVTAIGELVRVLRPGGVLAVSVPRAGPERVNWALSREYHDIPGGHVRIYRRRELVRKLELSGLVVIGAHHAHGLHAPYWWLRCAVGVANEHNRAVALYHRLLVWDITARPLITRVIDRALNPFIGKSLVLYCEKPA